VPDGFELFAKDWGPTSLLSFFVLAVGLAFLIPRWTVNKMLEEKDKRIAEAHEREKTRKEENDKLQETVRLQASQLDALMEQARTTLAILSSIEATASTGQGRHHAG
jgi:cell division protein FtsB